MNTNLKANIGYGLAFGMYFSTYCIIASFNSVYLLAHNYTNTEIGILIAVGNLVSVAMLWSARAVTPARSVVRLFRLGPLLAPWLLTFLVLHYLVLPLHRCCGKQFPVRH